MAWKPGRQEEEESSAKKRGLILTRFCIVFNVTFPCNPTSLCRPAIVGKFSGAKSVIGPYQMLWPITLFS